MQIGMIGLGRMGMNMVRRLLKGKHKVIAYNRTPGRVKEIVKEGERFHSRETNAFSEKVLAALRQEFGGHAVLKAGQRKPK